jgi:hypothetical protein
VPPQGGSSRNALLPFTKVGSMLVTGATRLLGQTRLVDYTLIVLGGEVTKGARNWVR